MVGDAAGIVRLVVQDAAPLMSAITEKYRRIAEIANPDDVKSVLDVGCRDGLLREWLPGLSRYVGIDLVQNERGTVDVVCDVSQGLPVPDHSFDAVIALDLLEHLDDMTSFLDEMDRASGRLICVALPNLAHASFRLNFLLRGRLSGKYDLKYRAGKDRHRWLTVVPQTDAFIEGFVRDRGYTMTSLDLPSGSRRHRAAETILRMLGFGRSWHVWRTLYVIRKRPHSVTSG